MEFTEVVGRRRMVRRYDRSRPVPREHVDRLLDCARRAPSAGHSQGWQFLVLDDAVGRAAYWASTTDPTRSPGNWLVGMQTAPVLIVVFSERAAYERRYAEGDKQRSVPVPLEQRWTVPYWHVDAGGAALLLLLGAVDAGLGACFFGVPPERVASLRAQFRVPDGLEPVGVVSLGYPPPASEPGGSHQPSGSGRHRPRRPVEQIVHYGRFPAAG